MFEIGSYVVYRSEGVCVISDIRCESFGSGTGGEEYYILTPVGDSKSTVFVPVNNPTLVGYMRELLDADAINKMLCEVRGKTFEWIEDSRMRNNQFREILASGDRTRLIMLINTLSKRFEDLHAIGRKCTSTEAGMYARAKRLLFEEFSATTDIGSIDRLTSALNGELELKNKA